MQRALLFITLVAAFGCSTSPCVDVERHAFQLAEKNREHVNQVRLGQTLVEVERIMGPPERRAARLRYDGVSIEEWSYVTDYMRKSDSLILFVGGKVQEIQAAPWDAEGEENEAERKRD